MNPIYINPAEAILDPLWDGGLSGFRRKLWTVQPGESHGLRIFSNWAWLQFEWASRPASGPALQLSREFAVEVSHFDQLLVSLNAPLNSIVRLRVETDGGLREVSFEPAPAVKRECAVPLKGATRILGLAITIEATQDGPANGWFNWVGLQDSRLLPSYLRSLRSYDSKWELHLKPEDDEPTFALSYGIVVSEEELAIIREKHAAHLQEFGASSYTKAAEIARQVEPESRINDFVNFWGDTRFSRERDHGRDLLCVGASEYGISLALAGQFTKDKGLLRHAARFALSLAHCPHWDDGMISRLPGSSWEHRCFVISLCCHAIGVVLDLAGELFTNEGKSFLLRRLAESGMGAINFQTWRHDYIFKCNQLAWFSPGRILASTILERHYPRVKPYTEIAYQELLESLEATILPDGGYVEGVVYFSCAVGKDGGRALAYYARSRGKTLADVIPDCLRRSADFGAALSSTDEDADIIPICDNGSGRADQPLLAAMASALPQSHWVNLYRKSLARTQGLPEDLFALQLASQIPESAPPPAALITMPVMGVVASHRPYQGGTVKLFLMGNLANAGHTHEDKGSFVLEVAGETLALDAGVCEYASSLARVYQSAQRHSMLVPTGTLERAQPKNPLPADIRPQAEGDETFFRAEVDLTPGWEGYYEFWKRCWDSPTPDTLVITDDYALAQGDGVDFLWQTRHPVTIEGNKVRIQAKRSVLSIEVPAGCTARVDALPLHKTADTQQCIVIHSSALRGTLQVVARWQVTV